MPAHYFYVAKDKLIQEIVVLINYTHTDDESYAITNIVPTIFVGTITNFIEQTPVNIANLITVNDINGNTDWNGGTLKVQITANATASDILQLPSTNTGGIWLNSAGNILMANTTAIGVASAMMANNANAWLFTFNAAATNALVQNTARAIQFNNNSDAPDTSVRIVTFTASDKYATIASTTQAISIIPVNDAPVFTVFSSTVANGLEDTLATISFSDLLASGNQLDADGTVSAFVIKSLNSGFLKIGTSLNTASAWNALTNNIIDPSHHGYWIPDTNANGTLDAFSVVAKDNNGLESTTPIKATITVISVIDLPTLASSDINLSVASEALTSYVGTLVFNNFDLTNNLKSITTLAGDANGLLSSTVTNSLSIAKVEWTYSFKPSTLTGMTIHNNANLITVSLDDGNGNILKQSQNINCLSGSLFGDTLTGTSDIDIILGGRGNDILNGVSGQDALIGGVGNDTYIIDSLDGTVVEKPNEGTDEVKSSINYTLGVNLENLTLTGSDNINGTGNTANNFINGNSGNNILTGGEGIDHLNGNGGNDTFIISILPNGQLEDTATAGIGNDTIKVVIGSQGNYSGTGTTLSLPFTIENIDISNTGSAILNLKGSNSNNLLTGNNANNLFDGNTGIDTLFGGLGDDTYIIKNSADKVIELIGQGYDTVNSDVNFDLSTNGNNVEKLTLTGIRSTNATGNSLDNLLTGNIFTNTLSGNDGNDTLYGKGGNDNLNGGVGNDLLIGGAGNDSLTGGSGTDTFWFDSAPNNLFNKDTITDFTSGTDKMQFSALVFNKLSVSGHFSTGDTRFWSNTTGIAHDATDRLIYSSTTGKLFYDADGSGANGSVLIALLTNHPVLVATDIWVF